MAFTRNWLRQSTRRQGRAFFAQVFRAARRAPRAAISYAGNNAMMVVDPLPALATPAQGADGTRD
jgi:hypothetical protein